MDALRRLVARVRERPRLQALALVLLVFAAFASSLPNRWIWDDNDYVTDNEVLTEEGGLARIWTEPTSLPQYYPLVHTTFWLERRLWGDGPDGGPNPFGFHLDNLLLHAGCALLLWRLLVHLGLPGAWLLAAVWAVHPINVESVAWVTERKNVLSLTLALASALQLLRWGEGGSWRAFALGALLFLGALASKTVVASLPAVVILLLWWRRRPLPPRVLGPLLLLLALGGLAGWMTAVAEVEHVGAEGKAWDFTLLERTLIAGRVLWSYAGKLVWPADLVFIYPRWSVEEFGPEWWLWPAAALALAAGLALAARRIGRGPLVAVLIFGGVLFPALGFLNVYPHQFSFVADHFQHHAAPALIVLLGRILFFDRAGAPRPGLLRWGAPVLLLLLAGRSFARCFAYEDEATLWRDTIARNPGASIAYNNLGRMKYEESRRLARRAASPETAPDQRAELLARSEELLQESIDLLERAVATGPDHAQALNNLGQVLLGHRLAQAPPGEADALARRIEDLLLRAVEAAPEYVKPEVNLGDLYLRRGDGAAAIRHYERAQELNTRNLSRLAGKPVEGRIPQVSINLAVAQLHAGRPQEAVENLLYATRSKETAVFAAINLTWVLASHPDPRIRDPKEAVAWARRLAATPAASDPRVLDASAAAYAAAGDFQRAVQIQTDGVFGAMRSGDDALAGRMRKWLEAYKNNRPPITRFGLPE
ncbi:MAG: hypothetical protein D6702_05185 [Planctomycetota bacterium]|nr:MAG: hypothetical protein D6702_05185 [Planctomycetota bacterium]